MSRVIPPRTAVTLALIGTAAAVITGTMTAGPLRAQPDPGGSAGSASRMAGTDDAGVELPERDRWNSTTDARPGVGSTPTTAGSATTEDGQKTATPTCRPQGCELWRVRVADGLRAFDVTSRWIAVVDGFRLRVRGTNRSDPQASGWVTDLREATDPQGDPVIGISAGGRALVSDVQIADDGSVLIAQRNGILVVGGDGLVRWHRDVDHLVSMQLHGPQVVAYATDPEGLQRQDRHATVLSLADGRTLWEGQVGQPVEGSPFGLVTLRNESDLALLDPATGAPTWQVPLEAPRWLFAEGPWIVVSQSREADTLLLDGASGEVMQRYPDLIPIGRVQHAGEVSVASWLQEQPDLDPARSAVVIAWDREGRELWQRRFPIGTGSACCLIAMPWTDGTVAIGRIHAPDAGWTIVDQATGRPRHLDAGDLPPFPLAEGAGARYLQPQPGGLFVHMDDDTLWLASAEGDAVVPRSSGVALATSDPPVVVRPGELVGLRLVPAR